LWCAVLPPIGCAAIIDVADVRLTALGSFTTQGQPDKTRSDLKFAPLHSLDRADVLVVADSVPGIPFPNLPTGQTRPFASSVADANGFFGVGISGFFFLNALPPNFLSASGTTTHSLTNNSAVTLPVTTDFFIPAPTILFFGVGNSFPAGADR